MKKNYNAPLVEEVSMVAKYNMLQAGSPATEELPTSYNPGTSMGGN